MAQDININDIAEYAGVSVSTVSRVMNNHPDVSKPTRERVMKIIEEHSYVPNNSARNLKRESFRAIGVVVKGFANPFFSRMLNVIYDELAEREYTPLISPVDPSMDEVESAIILGKEKKPMGMIFLGGNFKHSRDRLSLLEAPYVMLTTTIHSGVDRSAFSSVTVDDYGEAYKIVDYICKSGHKKIAIIGHSQRDISIGNLRLKGYMQAMRDNGLPVGESSVAYAGSYSMAGGYAAAKRLLRDDSHTCFFCISDIMALGAIRAIHDSGKSVPDDISVMGFDGIEHSFYSVPSLSTIRQPDELMTKEGLRILLNHLETGASHDHIIYPAKYQEGESFRSLG